MEAAPTIVSKLSTEAFRLAPQRRRSGLQQKLVASFMGILALAMGVTCWLVISESRGALDSLVAGQTLELVRTLGMSSQTPLATRDIARLNRIARELLKHRDIVAVAFFDAEGRRLAIASEDPNLEHGVEPLRVDPRRAAMEMLHPHARWIPTLGRFVEVTAPVTNLVVRDRADWMGEEDEESTSAASGLQSRGQLVGYIALCVSQATSDRIFQQIHVNVIVISAVALLATLPIAITLIHRLLDPVRRLVAATDRIAAGDLEAQVAVDRQDVIGTLATSFNRMAQKVREQQGELACANACLAEANRSLEVKVLHRTAELETANQKLSSEIAEKEEFLRAVSHDLSAPLRNISGMAMMLMKKRDHFDEDVVHRLERIQKNVEVETDLISELLELSRIKTRRHRMEAIDTAALVADIAGVFEEDFRANQIRFLVDTPLPVLYCERARLRQVFQNLIDNAIKYMGQSTTREIHVGCTLIGDGADFYVRDSGIGIPGPDLDNIFHVFRRGRNAQVQKIAGKGVGLATVKSIVETYGGRIRVESLIGAGSRFSFTIDADHLGGKAHVKMDHPSERICADPIVAITEVA